MAYFTSKLRNLERHTYQVCMFPLNAVALKRGLVVIEPIIMKDF